jgi:hypothetical protein
MPPLRRSLQPRARSRSPARSGHLRIAKRRPSEAGVAGYEVADWVGMLAPAGTAQPIVNKLNAEIKRLLPTLRWCRSLCFRVSIRP